MNDLHYINHLIDTCEEKRQHLERLLHEFRKSELHTKQTHGYTHYMIHRNTKDRIYGRKQDRPICRELAVKSDVEAQLEDCLADLAILRTIRQCLHEHPHAREKLLNNSGIRILLDEAYELLRQNGTFFNEKEWRDMVLGKVDERFWKLAGDEYRAIVKAERARLTTHSHTDPLPADEIQIPENISPRMTQICMQAIRPIEDVNITEWMHADYQKCPYLRENLIYPSSDGERFRSKLEVHAAEILKQLAIAYRYEAALQVGDNLYYPDFTLLHPQTFQLIYLEIFGMMDDNDYCRKAARKLFNYTTNGFVLGKNLLIYTETADSPLDFEMMTKDLRHIFLP